MFIPWLPPPEYPRISAVEYRICPARDPKCHIEFLNDAGDGLVSIVSPSAWSSVRTFDIVASMSGAGDMRADLERVPGGGRMSAPNGPGLSISEKLATFGPNSI